LISKGFLAPARRHALELVKSIQRLDPEGKLPIVGIEPSEIYTLRDEYLDLFPDDQFVRQMAERAWMLDEFLIRPGHAGIPRIERIKDCMEPGETPQQVLLHGHCYQKVQPLRADGYPVGVSASRKLLESCGYAVKVLDTGCCGVAGAFGYEAEHYEVSINVGNLTLLPAIRKAMEGGSVRPLIAASGVSCQTQIVDGTDQPAYHPIVLVERAITPR
jgi:Fe-S oxidoreductase